MKGTQGNTGIYPRPVAAFAASLALLTLLSLSGCAAEPSLADRQTTILTWLGFEPVSDGWQLTLPERISFEVEHAELAPGLRDSVADVARQLLAVDIRQLRVEGHTDNRGSREYNQNLSLRRASSVAAVLVTAGFAQEDVESQGYGADQPAADNTTEEGRAQNRRVEIIVTSNVLAVP